MCANSKLFILREIHLFDYLFNNISFGACFIQYKYTIMLISGILHIIFYISY